VERRSWRIFSNGPLDAIGASADRVAIMRAYASDWECIYFEPIHCWLPMPLKELSIVRVFGSYEGVVDNQTVFPLNSFRNIFPTLLFGSSFLK
jgi:hypothetical protein